MVAFGKPGATGCPRWDPGALSPPASAGQLVGFAGAALGTRRRHRASSIKNIWVSGKISFSVCNLVNAFFSPCNFHNLGKIEQSGIPDTWFYTEKGVCQYRMAG